MNALDTLKARGFVQTSTDYEQLSAHLESGSRTFYVGFDPTGDSLHVGHIVPVMAMAWLQRFGHRPIAVLGGGTAMVGDPTGKDQSREILTPEIIAQNRECFRTQLAGFLEVSDPHAQQFAAESNDAILVDNGEWLLGLKYIDFLRDIGRHFSINRMLSAEGTKQRLERDQGMSFIEFNYHLLQSYDFLVLKEKHDCTIQVGGDDQWFNILGGVNLIRRAGGGKAHAMTVPLIATADGKKMGKTEAGAVWLDGKKLSPFDYYQYWVNVQDADVDRFLKLYTFLDLEKIGELAHLQGADIRQAKAVLAFEATAIAHGREAAEQARKAAEKLFSGQSTEGMPTHSVQVPILAIDALADSGLTPSKGAARRLIKMGGARFEKDKLTDVDALIHEPGVLWAGKKRAIQLVSDAS